MKIKLIIFLLIFVVTLFCISCSQIIEKVAEIEVKEEAAVDQKEEDENGIKEESETETEELEAIIEPIEEVELPNPTSSEGCGSVTGRVFWNSQPVNGARLTLCEKFSTFSGCEGQKYEADSDEKGIYCIENVPVGEYAIIVQLPGEEGYLYVGDFIKGATKINIVEGETNSLENIHIFKTDLKLISPTDKEEIDTRVPTLEWEDYSSAEYYYIYLTPEAGDVGKLIDEKIEENIYSIQKSLLNCKFTWKIEAFNQYGRKIAESEYFYFFVSVDCPSCYLKLLTPSDKERIKQGTAIDLSWEEHPLVDEYNLSVRNTATNEYLVDFVKIDSTSYEITEAIPEGEYYWGVFVVDSFGTNIAYGASYFEIVK